MIQSATAEEAVEFQVEGVDKSTGVFAKRSLGLALADERMGKSTGDPLKTFGHGGAGTGPRGRGRGGACLGRAREAGGRRRETSEGVAPAGGLHPLQQAVLEEAALQCGICTPGFLVAAKALLEREPAADEHRIRHWLAGNLCRCTGYDKIVRAVLRAEAEQPKPRARRSGTS